VSRFPFRLALALVLGGVVASAARLTFADEPIDDPKVGRRLGTRVDWSPSEASKPRVGEPAKPAASEASKPRVGEPAKPAASEASKPTVGQPGKPLTSEASKLPVGEPAKPLSAEGPKPIVGELAKPAASDGSGAAAVVERVAPPPARTDAFSPPRLELAFRRFNFVQIGAAGSSPGIAATEPFNSIALDVYPLSSLVRLGLSTQYGWQSGTWTSSGDYFAAESVSAGVQLRGDRVVPFGEAFAGLGYMRRLQFDRTIPTAYWQLGADIGVDVFLARSGFVSVAVGYLRAVNGFLVAQQFTSAFLDTWSFKLGVGL
jgi:hypothetical protein